MKPPKIPALMGKKMSVGIGTRYERGLVICTDTKVVLSDGSTKVGTKLRLTQCGLGTFAIVNAATDDGNAGAVLSEEIAEDLFRLKAGGSDPFVAAIKNRLRIWHAGYGSPSTQPPATQFIIAVEARGYGGVYFVEPPQTVIYHYSRPLTIGGGAAAVDPLLSMVLPEIVALRPTILKLAYLMYRAKKEQGALVGGPTDLIVIRKDGDFRWLSTSEMNSAEKAIAAVDSVLRDCCRGLLCCHSDEDQRKSLTKFNDFFMKKSETFRNIRFPSLDGFDV